MGTPRSGNAPPREANAGHAEPLGLGFEGFERANGLPVAETGSQITAGGTAGGGAARASPEPAPAAPPPPGQSPQDPAADFPVRGWGGGWGEHRAPSLLGGITPTYRPLLAPSPLRPQQTWLRLDPGGWVCPRGGEKGPRGPEPRAPSGELPAAITRARPPPPGCPPGSRSLDARQRAQRGETRGQGGSGHRSLARRVRSARPAGMRGDAAGAQDVASPRTLSGGSSREGKLRLRGGSWLLR